MFPTHLSEKSTPHLQMHRTPERAWQFHRVAGRCIEENCVSFDEMRSSMKKHLSLFRKISARYISSASIRPFRVPSGTVAFKGDEDKDGWNKEKKKEEDGGGKIRVVQGYTRWEEKTREREREIVLLTLPAEDNLQKAG